MAYVSVIASIDPGKTIGIAIAEVQETVQQVRLVRKYLGSTNDAYEVLSLISINGCDHVVMERRPDNASASNIVVVVYDELLLGLTRGGYKEQQHFRIVDSQKSVFTITPGMWKPVMHGKLIGGGVWRIADVHQHDALALLHYFVKLNHMKQEVCYGKQ